MGSSKRKVTNRAHPLFIIPCLSLRRRGRRGGCCLEKAKGGEEREKFPDQGAIVTMATVSAPAPLKLGEVWDYGIPQYLPPSLSPPHLKPTTLSPALWKKPLGKEGQQRYVWGSASSFTAGGQPSRGKQRSLHMVSWATAPTEHTLRAFWPSPCY